MAEEKLDESKDMSFWEHLEALRQGLFHVIIALLAAFIVLFFFKDFLFDDLILAPTRSDFFFYKWFGMETGLQLVNIELSTQFMVHMRVTFMCAIILCCPYILFEIWRFIAPALYQNEKRATRRAFLFASFLFYFGIAVGYCIILPLMVNFFDGYKVSEAVIRLRDSHARGRALPDRTADAPDAGRRLEMGGAHHCRPGGRHHAGRSVLDADSRHPAGVALWYQYLGLQAGTRRI